MKWLIALASLALLVSPDSISCTTKGKGSISGTILDEKGMPLVGAMVRADLIDSRPMGKALNLVETDANGHFLFSLIELTSYKIFAMKESAGYPNTAAAFYSHQVFLTVTLTESMPTADITLKLGPPAAMVTGIVTNAITAAPLDVSVLLRRVSDPDEWISIGQRAAYRVLVPPDADVFVEVSAPGYKTWYYGGPSDSLKRPPIRLDSGKEMKLDIKLEPEMQPENQAD